MSASITDSLAVLTEPGGLETVLLNAGALPLLADVQNSANLMGLEAGAFAELAVRRFLDRASHEDWATLTSQANANDDALGSVIVVILRKAVADANEVFR